MRKVLTLFVALLFLWIAGCETTPEFSSRRPLTAAPLSSAPLRAKVSVEPPAALTTVTVPEEIVVAPAAPLVAPPQPLPSLVITSAASLLLLPSSPPTNAASSYLARTVWPTNWINVWIPLESWGKYNGLSKPVQTASHPAPTYEFHTTNGGFSFQIGSRVALCNGLECWLGFAPQIVKGLPCVHWLDAQKNLQPLLESSGYRFQGGRSIVIDPGHGGKDSGTQTFFKTSFEKEYTLDWAMRLARLLLTNGWKVTLTRTNDHDLTLAERVATADRVKADLFLSLHFNSGLPNRALAGVETYCLTPVGMPSSLIRDYEDNFQHAFPNNSYDEQNFQLACRLHHFVVQGVCGADRGVRRARFMGVLRGQNRPAVLIEAGYLSNASEAKRINSPEYRQKLAEAVAGALE